MVAQYTLSLVVKFNGPRSRGDGLLYSLFKRIGLLKDKHVFFDVRQISLLEKTPLDSIKVSEEIF